MTGSVRVRRATHDTSHAAATVRPPSADGVTVLVGRQTFCPLGKLSRIKSKSAAWIWVILLDHPSLVRSRAAPGFLLFFLFRPPTPSSCCFVDRLLSFRLFSLTASALVVVPCGLNSCRTTRQSPNRLRFEYSTPLLRRICSWRLIGNTRIGQTGCLSLY